MRKFRRARETSLDRIGGMAGVFALLVIVMVLSGCLGSSVIEDKNSPIGTTQDGIFELTVDWSTFDSLAASAVSNVDSDRLPELLTPTHVSARLVYINADTDYVQMTDRSTAEKEGVITMKVPPGEAVLQVVVVHHNDERLGSNSLCLVLYGAVQENLVIRGNQVTKLSLDDLTLCPFKVRWTREWEGKFDDNNIAFVTSADCNPDYFDELYITPTIEFSWPIHSEKIPSHLREVRSGEAMYKWTTEDKWGTISYWNDHHTFTAKLGVPVSDALDGFVIREGDTRMVISEEYTGWLTPYIIGSDWNLRGFKYYASTAPRFSVDGGKRPTEFTLIWVE